VIGVAMMPWKLMESAGSYVFTWLIGYSGLMGAIGGIMICDYWVLRRQRLDVDALFDPRGKYSYTNGINWRAMIALLLAIAPCVPGFLDAATGSRISAPELLKTIYTYAWFVTFGLGFAIYHALMTIRPPMNAGSEGTTDGRR
jgi:NCS1 family nucleobase:cation symporter-1